MNVIHQVGTRALAANETRRNAQTATDVESHGRVRRRMEIQIT